MSKLKHKTSDRKDEQAELSLDDRFYLGQNDLDTLPLPYHTFYDGDWDDLRMPTMLFGQTLNYPFIIACMTGGSKGSESFNKTARACAARLGIGMGLGSIRAYVEGASIETYGGAKRDDETLLMANIGVGQLRKGALTAKKLQPFLERMRVDALYCHFNVLQEWVQYEGDRHFSGITASIEDLVRHLNLPVIAKEVGNGVSKEAALKMKEVGISAIECAALGGTSWTRIEGERARLMAQPKQALMAEFLDGYGVSLKESILACREALGEKGIVIASGGIQTPVQAVKALRLGADAIAVGRPVYKAWHEGGETGMMTYLEAFCESMGVVQRLASS